MRRSANRTAAALLALLVLAAAVPASADGGCWPQCERTQTGTYSDQPSGPWSGYSYQAANAAGDNLETVAEAALIQGMARQAQPVGYSNETMYTPTHAMGATCQAVGESGCQQVVLGCEYTATCAPSDNSTYICPPDSKYPWAVVPRDFNCYGSAPPPSPGRPAPPPGPKPYRGGHPVLPPPEPTGCPPWCPWVRLVPDDWNGPAIQTPGPSLEEQRARMEEWYRLRPQIEQLERSGR